MKRTYVSGNLSRKRYWDNIYKTRKRNKALHNFTYFGGYYIKNKGTEEEYVGFIPYTSRGNTINQGKELRRRTNKRIRKMSCEEISSYCNSKYKRVFDYWWEIA